jgi:eukaryotic-like serine/threonine-protein kinase
VLAKVIGHEPDWAALPASTPPRLRELLRRCTRKDPKTRLQAVGDARIQIEELISGATEEAATAVAARPHGRGARFAVIVAALSLAITAALAVPSPELASRGIRATSDAF